VHRPQAEAATTRTVADRERGLTFAPDVSLADRQWILAAVAKARPEAARLIDEIDGFVRVTTFREPGAWLLGWAQTNGPTRYEIRFNVARLDGTRQIDRVTVVPSAGVCLDGTYADCAQSKEKFADTFAKWALRGAVSIVGAGYSVPSPASLEDWGTPLSALAIQLEVEGS
jgi:hypothetical protein